MAELTDEETTRTVVNPLKLVALKLEKVSGEMKEETQALVDTSVDVVDATLEDEAPIISQAFNSSRDLVTKIIEKEQEEIKPDSKVVIDTNDNTKDIVKNTDKTDDLLGEVVGSVDRLTDVIIAGQPTEEELRELQRQNKMDNAPDDIIPQEDETKSIWSKMSDNLVLTWTGLLRGLSAVFATLLSPFAPLIKMVTSGFKYIAGLFKTIFTSIGKLFGGIVKVIGKAFLWIGVIVGIVNSIKKAFEVFDDDSLDLSEKIFAVLGAFIEGFTLGLLDGDKMGQIMDDAWNTIKEFTLNTMVPALLEVFNYVSGIFTELYNKHLAPIIDKAILKMQNFFRELLGEELFNDIASGIKFVTDKLTELFSWYKEKWLAAFDFITNLSFDDVVNYITNIPNMILQSIKDGIDSLFGEGATDTILSVLNTIWDAITFLPRKLLEIWDSVFNEGGMETFLSVINDIWSAVTSFPSAIMDLWDKTMDMTSIKTGISDILGKFTGIFDKFTELWDDVFSGNVFDNVTSGIKSGIDKLGNVMSAIFGRFGAAWSAYQSDGIKGAFQSLMGLAGKDEAAKVEEQPRKSTPDEKKQAKEFVDDIGKAKQVSIYDLKKSDIVKKSVFSEAANDNNTTTNNIEQRSFGPRISKTDIEPVSMKDVEAANDQKFDVTKKDISAKIEPVEKIGRSPVIEKAVDIAERGTGTDGPGSSVFNNNAVVTTSNNTYNTAPLNASNSTNFGFERNNSRNFNMAF